MKHPVHPFKLVTPLEPKSHCAYEIPFDLPDRHCIGSKTIQDLQTQESLKYSRKIFESLADFLELLLQLLKNHSRTSRDSSFMKYSRKIFRSLTNFLELLKLRKSFRISKDSRRLRKIVEKYLKAQQTLWNFYNLRSH